MCQESQKAQSESRETGYARSGDSSSLPLFPLFHLGGTNHDWLLSDSKKKKERTRESTQIDENCERGGRQDSAPPDSSVIERNLALASSSSTSCQVALKRSEWWHHRREESEGKMMSSDDGHCCCCSQECGNDNTWHTCSTIGLKKYTSIYRRTFSATLQNNNPMRPIISLVKFSNQLCGFFLF